MRSPKKRLGILLALTVAGLAATAPAQFVIGSWQGNADGWNDNGNGLSITDPANAAKYGFASGTVSGYGQSLRNNQSGFGLNLKFNLASYRNALNAFLNGNFLSFTFSVPDASSLGVRGGSSQIFSLTINAPGYGYNNQPWANAMASGDTGNNQSSMPNYYFWSTAPTRSQTVPWTTPASCWRLFPGGIVSWNSSSVVIPVGGAPDFYHLNNVILSAVPEPAGLALVGLGTMSCSPLVGVCIAESANDLIRIFVT